MKKNKYALFYWTSLLVFACGVVVIIAWTATLSPASSMSPENVPASRAFGFAQIAKPTYTPTPTIVPTPTPPPAAQIEALSDTPAPDGQTAPYYAGNKYVLVDISEQRTYAYEGDALVYDFIVSTGIRNGTRVGRFNVLEKIPNAYGSTWDIWMPNWIGIYWSGGLQNGFHALPILPNGATLWEGYLGTPISYGCIVLGTYESQLLYDWVELGVPVEIQR